MDQVKKEKETELQESWEDSGRHVIPPLRLGELFEDPYAVSRVFWLLLFCSALMGALVGLFAIVFFLAVDNVPSRIFFGSGNYTTVTIDEFSYLGGQWYWILIGLACGLVVGITKAMFLMDRYPHLFHILKSRDVHYLTALLVVFLTIVGQIGGVPLGPEAGLAAGGAAIGKACGMLLEKILPARFVHPDAQTLLCLAGITASLAPLFPSPPFEFDTR